MLSDAYGCVVANRFGNLLDDDADPFDLLDKVETVKEKKNKKREDDEKKGKMKKNSQKESQKDRRVPVTMDSQDPVPGKLQLARIISPHHSGSCEYFYTG